MRIKLLIISFCLLLPSMGLAQDKVFNAEQFKLDNGMEVVVIPNTRTPVITHMVWYKVGAADEPPGKSGIAHFLEHLMFKGSDDLDAGEFSKTVRSLGGNDNAFTSQDYTAYFQSIAVEHLEKVMRMEAGRMRGLNPPAAEVDSERLVILEERRQRTDNSPSGRFQEQAGAALFVNHPYGTPVIGWGHEMEGLSWRDAKDFYDRWYGPNNAILIVTGDVTGAEVLKLAQEIYGTIPPLKDLPARERLSSPPLGAMTKISLPHEAVREPSSQVAYRVASHRQNKDDALALTVLDNILGSGATSRLYKSLVVEQKLAGNAGSSYRENAWDDAVFWIQATPKPGIKIEDVEAAILDELRKIARDGVSDDEVKESITRLQAEAIYARDSLTGPAMVVGFALSTGTELDDIETWPQRIETVTAAQVQEVAQRYMDPDNPGDNPVVVGRLLPKEAVQ